MLCCEAGKALQQAAQQGKWKKLPPSLETFNVNWTWPLAIGSDLLTCFEQELDKMISRGSH